MERRILGRKTVRGRGLRERDEERTVRCGSESQEFEEVKNISISVYLASINGAINVQTTLLIQI